jgi:hypothetical protein
MSDPVLVSGEYSIGHDGSSSAFVFGNGANNIQIQNTATDTGTINVQDQAVVGHDGLVFGYDTLPGQVVTYTGMAMVPAGSGATAMDANSALAGAWNDPSVRLVDGAVQVLRAFYRGSNVVRRTYGRGRKIMPTMGQVFQGLVPFTAQFQSADNTWYSDTLYSITIGMVPSFFGTMTPPLTPPYQLSSSHNYQQNMMTNTGSLPTWPVFTFNGPITNPLLTYVNTPVSIGYTGQLKSTDSLVIDTRPWARTAMLNGNPAAAGNLLGSAMIAMQAQPGATLVRFSGQDQTGASTCTITWRNATLSIGGSY